ncbi:hypothetical protein KIPB_005471 [Kipferlia bialata]|uniref:Uncharacterized protein n=1 Tax=Kipferlia bialata TaxID=797122 RepID=A0A9K3GHE2_9EUKA|nr:hypothetical protein KIPB_005471 [Kipferlia bialata]|eukprot:g5471.t1
MTIGDDGSNVQLRFSSALITHMRSVLVCLACLGCLSLCLGGSVWSANITSPETFSDAPNFGDSLGVSGDWAIIGAAREYRSETDTSIGAVFMYHDLDGVWVEHSRLAPPTPEHVEYIGQIVAIDGEWAAVGCNTLDRYGRKTGSIVGVYHLVNDEWVLQFSNEDDSAFVYSVAMGGGVLVLGYPYASRHAGEALVYRLTGSEYVLETTIVGAKRNALVAATVAVSADGSRVLTGSQYDGQVYVYDYVCDTPVGAQWVLTTTVTADCAVDMPLAIASSGLPFAVADWSSTTYHGAVQIFDSDEETGDIVCVQTIPGGGRRGELDNFGDSMAFSSDASLLAVGAPERSTLFIYARDASGMYSQVDRQTSCGTAEGNDLGSSLSFARGDTLLMSGDPSADGGTGVVAEFDVSMLMKI